MHVTLFSTPIMSTVLRIANTLTWDPKNISDGPFIFNNKTFYFHGSGVSVIADIVEILNLTMETTFGDYYEALDLVANGSADIGSLLMSQDSKWIDRGLGSLFVYLHPLDSETSNVYFKQPPADSAKYTITRPFSTELWTFLLFFMLIVSIIFNRGSKYHPFYSIYKTAIQTIELLIDRHDVHFRLSHMPPSIAIARLVISFFGIIIISVYIAKIASIFVVREDLVKTPDDLIKYKYKFHTYSNLHVNRVFEKSNQRNVTADIVNFTNDFSFLAHIIGKPNSDPRETLFSHPDGFYANAIYTLNLEQELCHVSVIKSIRKTPRSFCIGKGSLFKEAINLSIVKLIERGINNRHQVKFKKKFQYQCALQETEFNQLTLRFVELGFVPLLIGFIVAVVLDTMQYLINWVQWAILNKLRTKSKLTFLV